MIGLGRCKKKKSTQRTHKPTMLKEQRQGARDIMFLRTKNYGEDIKGRKSQAKLNSENTYTSLIR